jgi:hypothetical protein
MTMRYKRMGDFKSYVQFKSIEMVLVKSSIRKYFELVVNYDNKSISRNFYFLVEFS